MFIKLKFTGNRFFSTCCSEDVTLGVITNDDVMEAASSSGNGDTCSTAEPKEEEYLDALM